MSLQSAEGIEGRNTGRGMGFPTQPSEAPSTQLLSQIYVFAHFCPSHSLKVSVCESVCVCTCKKMNEGVAPGVMPLFCPYSKWKLCLLMEKGLVAIILVQDGVHTWDECHHSIFGKKKKEE